MIDRGRNTGHAPGAGAADQPRGASPIGHARFRRPNLAIMRQIDALHLDYPFAGSRMLRDLLGRTGVRLADGMSRR